MINLETDGVEISSVQKYLIPFDLSEGVNNSAVLNQALLNIGQLTGVGIFDAIYTPGKWYAVTDPIVVPRYTGGRWITGGGVKYQIHESHQGSFNFIGSCTRLIHVAANGSAEAPSEPIIEFSGHGWRIDPIVLQAWPIHSSTDWNNAIAGTGVYANRGTVGMRVSKDNAQFFPVGNSVFDLMCVGFEKAVFVDSSPYDNHCDRLRFNNLSIALCDYGFYCVNSQSVGHVFLYSESEPGCTAMYYFSAGGNLSVINHGQIGPGDVLQTGAIASANVGSYIFEHIKIDNNAIDGNGEGWGLYRQVASVSSVPVFVRMSGFIGNDYLNNWTTGVTDPIVVVNGGSSKTTVQLNFPNTIDPDTATLYPR